MGRDEVDRDVSELCFVVVFVGRVLRLEPLDTLLGFELGIELDALELLTLELLGMELGFLEPLTGTLDLEDDLDSEREGCLEPGASVVETGDKVQ